MNAISAPISRVLLETMPDPKNITAPIETAVKVSTNGIRPEDSLVA
jgi:hypothetical protein